MVSPSGKASSVREVVFPLDSLPGAMRASHLPGSESSYDFDGLSLGGAWGGPLAFMGYIAAVVLL
jgi:hypothetical protein